MFKKLGSAFKSAAKNLDDAPKVLPPPFARLYSLQNSNSFAIEHVPVKSKEMLVISRKTSFIAVRELNREEELEKKNQKAYDIYGCLGIYESQKGLSYLVIVVECVHCADVARSEAYKITKALLVPFTRLSDEEVKKQKGDYMPVETLLSSGSFYFAKDYDLTNSQQRLITVNNSMPIWERADPRFFWNRHLSKKLIAAGATDWVMPVIHGYVGSAVCSLEMRDFLYTVVSRRSVLHAGTVNNARGIDDAGNCANYVETEQVICGDDGSVASNIVIRGSAPLYWTLYSDEKLEIYPGPKLTASMEIQSVAFRRHFAQEIKYHGEEVIVSLLGLGEQDNEATLSRAYSWLWKNLANTRLNFVEFDFHAVTSGGKLDNATNLRKQLEFRKEFERLGFFHKDSNGNVLATQKGVFRVSCLDCISRTNIVQMMLSRACAELELLKVPGISIKSVDPTDADYTAFESAFNLLWGRNGDAISIQYTGTGALRSDYTRTGGGQRTTYGMIQDTAKSATRMYNSLVTDSWRQEAIDLLLGQGKGSAFKDPRLERFDLAMRAREHDYSDYQDITVACCTFHVGGSKPVSGLERWLYLPNTPDVIAITLQGLVSLTTQSVLAADLVAYKAWEDHFDLILGSQYRKVSTKMLVNLFSLVYVRKAIDHLVGRDVRERSSTKAGLGGLAGGLKAIAVRLTIADSALAFVGAIFTHGRDPDRLLKRNEDFRDVVTGISFNVSGTRKAKTDSILDQDAAFVFGDLNYRVNLDNSEARTQVRSGNLDALLRRDELIGEFKKKDPVINEFQEGDITFPPTYQYEPGTDEFERSKKQRTPSWTDRVLYRGSTVQLLKYTRSDIRTSDHRPVSGMFRVTVRVIRPDDQRKVRSAMLLDIFGDEFADTEGPDAAAAARGYESFPAPPSPRGDANVAPKPATREPSPDLLDMIDLSAPAVPVVAHDAAPAPSSVDFFAEFRNSPSLPQQSDGFGFPDVPQAGAPAGGPPADFGNPWASTAAYPSQPPQHLGSTNQYSSQQQYPQAEAWQPSYPASFSQGAASQPVPTPFDVDGGAVNTGLSFPSMVIPTTTAPQDAWQGSGSYGYSQGQQVPAAANPFESVYGSQFPTAPAAGQQQAAPAPSGVSAATNPWDGFDDLMTTQKNTEI